MARILYISYDGMLEPLGQSQVLAYLEKLSRNHEFDLISFEKEEDRNDENRMAAMRERLAKRNISWTPLAYHKKPSALATAYDIAVGTWIAWRIARKKNISILHARSYVPALISILVKRYTEAKFLFDMRGFWADERIDGGLWPREGRLYRMTKGLEKTFLKASDHVVTLTHASEEEIRRFDYLQENCPPIDVIPTCADLERFSPQPVNADRPFTFGYVGSIGTWYLFDETLAFFKALLDRKPDARLLVVNRNEHHFVRQSVEKAGIPADKLELLAADHKDVPGLVTQMHVAGALIKPAYSKMASAPTKLAEYLGCGVPCLGNVNVGDMKEILEGNSVGIALPGFSESDIEEGLDRLLDLLNEQELSERCQRTAKNLFSLESGVEAYEKIYASLSSA